MLQALPLTLPEAPAAAMLHRVPSESLPVGVPATLQRLTSCYGAESPTARVLCPPTGGLTAVPLGSPKSPGTVAFRVCGERVEVAGTPRRCQHSLLATLVGSCTALPIRRNAEDEIPVTSASSAAAFRLLAHFVTSPDTPANIFECFGEAVLNGGQAHEALSAFRLDAEYFLGSTTSDTDFHDFKGALQQFALQHGASPGLLLCPQGMAWSVHSGVRPDVARLHRPLPPAPAWVSFEAAADGADLVHATAKTATPPAQLPGQAGAQVSHPPSGPLLHHFARQSLRRASAPTLQQFSRGTAAAAPSVVDASPAGSSSVLPVDGRFPSSPAAVDGRFPSSPAAAGALYVGEPSGPGVALPVAPSGSPPASSPPHGGQNAIAAAPVRRNLFEVPWAFPKAGNEEVRDPPGGGGRGSWPWSATCARRATRG